MLKERFFAERRRAAIELVREGMANGQLRPGLDPDLSIDVLFGAMVFRLFNGEAPLQREAAHTVARMAIRAIIAT